MIDNQKIFLLDFYIFWRVCHLVKSIDFYLNRLNTNLIRKKEIKIINDEYFFKESEYKIEVNKWSVI